MRRLSAFLLLAWTLAASQLAGAQASPELRQRFVRDQTLLGLTTYGPALAVATSDDAVSFVAAYLVMSGGMFFAAGEVTRHVPITEGRQLLATGLSVRGAGQAVAIASQSGAGIRERAAALLVGGLGGTAAGLVLGTGASGGQAAATLFGHDLAFASAMALTVTTDRDLFDTKGGSEATAAAVWAASGWLGAGLGRAWAATTPAQVTVGDVQTLWLGATIGVTAGATAVANGSPEPQTAALAMMGGALLGSVGANYALARRFDLTRGEANLVTLGSGAGALMGLGVGLLAQEEGSRDGATSLAAATAGAAVGALMTARFLEPTRDVGRVGALDRLRLDPLAAVAAATGRPGRHALLSYTF
ncbi:MAG: hypothetical protein RL340_43 [Gemmatimonadota bacterium]